MEEEQHPLYTTPTPEGGGICAADLDAIRGSAARSDSNKSCPSICSGGGGGSVGSRSESLHGDRPTKRAYQESIQSAESTTTARNSRATFWTRLATESNAWSDCDDDELEAVSMKMIVSLLWNQMKYMAQRNMRVMRAHPSIVLISLLLFIVLCGSGVALVLVFSQKEEDAVRGEALQLAIETGQFFSGQLDRAILPLFSMAQFIYELEIFRNLPKQIGPGGKNGSLPYLPPRVPGGDITHRNVSGVCDEPNLVNRFNEIAAGIKKNAGMEGVLINIQAVPQAAVCLLYPLNNTEDFDDGIFMDNTGAFGHDLAKDPARTVAAETTLSSDDIVIVGPLTLRQCHDCDPTVRQAFIARLAIASEEGNEIEINDNVYKDKWGFTVVLINWEELLIKSGIFETFGSRGIEFSLTRTDQKYDEETGEYYDKVVVLAETPNFDPEELEFVTTKLQTTNNEWEMSVSYNNVSWTPWALAGAALASAMIALLIGTVLIEKAINQDILQDLLPGKSLNKIKRGKVVIEKFDIVTIFFADIVGYTTMSSQMRPIEVMRMLNDFFSGMDNLAKKHGVYKMETIGDAYLVAGGLPEPCLGTEGATRVALFALEAIEFAKSFVTKEGLKVSIRAGISSGPAVAGVVGSIRPKYTVFGDTINTASRMESTSKKNRIQCTDMTYRLLRDARIQTFDLEARGVIDIKGKGEMHTWWLKSVEAKSAPTEHFTGVESAGNFDV
mmetsp:Transcript_3577/g.5998  ORF Transcript_3577/g.5998 Transcript_3577/m.5998 type:complete len:726 (-) Transcript_3577:367-2544(-)